MPLTPRQHQVRGLWLENEFKVDTYFLLKTFNHFNLDSRAIVARALAEEVYQAMDAKTGHFATLNEVSRRFAMDLIAIEIMSTVFMALEDFGKLLNVTKSPTKLWPEMLIATKEGRALSELEAAKPLSTDRVKQILCLKEASAYGLTDPDGILTRYHEHVTDELNRVFDRAARFVLLHRLAYDRYKHGNPVLFGMSGRSPAPGIEGPVAILKRPPSKKEGEIVLVGPVVIQRQLRLVDRVTHMSKMICQRWMQVAEFGGLPPLVLARVEPVEGQNAVRANYFTSMPEDIKPPLNALATRATSGLEWTPVEIGFEAQVQNALLDGLVKFYTED